MKEAVLDFNVQVNDPFAADLRWSILLYSLVVQPFSFVRLRNVISLNPEAFCFWGMVPLLIYEFHVDAIDFVHFVK